MILYNDIIIFIKNKMKIVLEFEDIKIEIDEGAINDRSTSLKFQDQCVQVLEIIKTMVDQIKKLKTLKKQN